MSKQLIVLFMLCSPAFLPSQNPVYGEGEVSALATHMKGINSDLRQLRRQLPDTTSKTENLRLLAGIKDRVLAARKERPLKTADLPEAERDSFLEAYRSTLDRVVVTLDELKVAIEAENLDTARQLIQKLNELKGEGHSRFQKE